MKLQPLTLITPKIQASDIFLFPALELIMSHQAIEEAITKTNSQEKRHRLLPTHLIITLLVDDGLRGFCLKVAFCSFLPLYYLTISNLVLPLEKLRNNTMMLFGLVVFRKLNVISTDLY
jgi:hypothetical protein